MSPVRSDIKEYNTLNGKITSETVRFMKLPVCDYDNIRWLIDIGDEISTGMKIGFSGDVKIYASCDAFLMPSLFEPCGLSQLMSLRYGTVPIVRETGGLKDTVQPYNEYESTGTGFSFANYNAHEMMNTINYAKYVFLNKKREWNKIIDRGMSSDYSWTNSAKKYQNLYDNLLN